MTIDDVHGQMIDGKRIQRAKWANAVIGDGRSDKRGMWIAMHEGVPHVFIATQTSAHVPWTRSETDQAASDWQVMEAAE